MPPVRSAPRSTVGPRRRLAYAGMGTYVGCWVGPRSSLFRALLSLLRMYHYYAPPSLSAAANSPGIDGERFFFSSVLTPLRAAPLLLRLLPLFLSRLFLRTYCSCVACAAASGLGARRRRKQQRFIEVSTIVPFLKKNYRSYFGKMITNERD